MSCIACECYATRITNIFRDEELKEKYFDLTGLKVLSDSFVCDECNEKLESFYYFKNQCVEIHRKLHPDYVDKTEEIKAEDPIFILGDENEVEGESFVEEFMVTADEANDIKSNYASGNDNDEQYDNFYLEFEEAEQQEDEEVVKNSKAKPAQRKSSVMNRKSYTVEEKLKIIQYAEENNNRATARQFNINESSVRCFRRQKEILLKMSPQKKTNRKAFPHWPRLEEELKEYVINHPVEHGTKAKLKEIKQEAIGIAQKHGIENFNGSNSYIFKFMQRHKLPSASPRPRKPKIELLTS